MPSSVVPPAPPFVALTGGLGSGKSTALAAFERLGAAVISSDAVVHELYGSDAVRDAVLARFGPQVAPGGTVSRAALAERVFGNEADRVWLEQLLWPLVRERVARWRAGFSADSPTDSRPTERQPRPRALVVEVPLLFESGGEDLYDATIAVIADESLREARARARGHSAVLQREARQLSQEEKAARSTFVVENNGTIDDLEAKLSSVLAKLDA